MLSSLPETSPRWIEQTVGAGVQTLIELRLSLLSRDSSGGEITSLIIGSLCSLYHLLCQEVSRAVTGRASCPPVPPRAPAQQGHWEGFLVQDLAGIWVEKSLQASTALKVGQESKCSLGAACLQVL